MAKAYNILNAEYVIFDFDGVFTDNKVYSDSFGNEIVCSSRSDSLGLNLLRTHLKMNNSTVRLIILSTECNPVVKLRAEKLKLECFQGVSSKINFLQNHLKIIDNVSMRAQNLVFLGNDLNDLGVMKVAGFGATPIDGHQLLKHHATYVSPQKGGKGFIRDVIEFLIGDELEDVAKNLY